MVGYIVAFKTPSLPQRLVLPRLLECSGDRCMAVPGLYLSFDHHVSWAVIMITFHCANYL